MIIKLITQVGAVILMLVGSLLALRTVYAFIEGTNDVFPVAILLFAGLLMIYHGWDKLDEMKQDCKA